MFLTPPEIQHQNLKDGRGYEKGAVDELLEQVTSSYEQVWMERDQLRSRLNELESEFSTLHDKERLLSDTLVTAQRAAEEVRAEADREAQRVRLEALADLGQAKAEAERELEALRAEIQRFRTHEREVRSNLRAFLEAALRQLEDHGAGHEAPLGTLVDALAPDAARADRAEG
jgi:cell division initiation protein